MPYAFHSVSGLPFRRVFHFARRYSALLLGLLALVLYLSTRSHHYTADSILYAMAIESGDHALIVDPYHLLLHPLGWFFYQLWRAVGWAGRSLFPLQVLNALGGALCVGLMYALVRCLTRHRWIAWLVALGFSVSGGVWLLSVEAEFVTIPLATQLLVLLGLLAVGPERVGHPGFAVLVGLGIVLATCTYLTGLFLLPVALVGLFLDGRQSWPVRRRQALIIGSTTLLPLLLIFGLLVASWAGGDAMRLIAAFDGGGIYGQLAITSLPHGVYTFLRSLALYPNLAMNDSTRVYLAQAPAQERILFAGYYGAVLLLAAAPVLAVLFRGRLLWRANRRTLGMLFTWVFLFGAFAVYWVPGDLSFWVPVLAAWWLLVAMVTASFFAAVASRTPGPSTAWLAAGVCLVTLLLVANATLLILPRHDLSRNQVYRFAADLSANTSPEDLIIAGNNDILLLYVSYFADRMVAPAALDANGLRPPTEWLGARVTEAYANGGQVYVVGIVTEASLLKDALLAARVRSPTLPWREAVLAWQTNGDAVWQLLP